MTLTGRPAGTRTPQETPAGSEKGCCRTRYPAARNWALTQPAARAYAGLAASRGPMAASARMPASAVALSNGSARGEAFGVGVVGIGTGVVGVAAVVVEALVRPDVG